MFVRVGDINLFYEEAGKTEDSLLLLHGLGMNCELWRSQVEVFSKEIRTIAVDLRGFGKSSKPDKAGAYAIDSLAEDIAGLIEVLSLKNCHLLGTSMGGFVAQSLVLNYPSLLKSLILCHTASEMSIPKKVLEERIIALSELSMTEYGKIVCKQACSERASGELKEWVISMIEKNDKSIYTKVLTEGLGDFNVTESLNSIRLPTLVITGKEDRVLPAENGRKMAKLIPDCRIKEIAGVGHLGYAEKPEIFNGHVLEFLKNR